MSKFIEMTLIVDLSDGTQKLGKMLFNTDIISVVYDQGKYREIVFKDRSSGLVKESYEELKEKLS